MFVRKRIAVVGAYVAIFCAAFMASSNAYAFTVSGREYWSPSNTYRITTAFANQSSGWTARADGAASDWTNSAASFPFRKIRLVQASLMLILQLMGRVLIVLLVLLILSMDLDI